MNDGERLELFNADEPVPVEACRVYLTNVGGQWHWSAQAADWVSLMTDHEVGGILHKPPVERWQRWPITSARHPTRTTRRQCSSW